MQQLQPGNTLQNGKFRIINVLGQGGFGITYLAHHQQFDSEVCIKEFFFKDFCNRDTATQQVSIGTESSRDMVERFKQKFLKEARTISRLHHTNIVNVIDIFEENGTAYYAMEFIEGRTLSEIVKAEGPLNAAEAVTCIRQVGSALGYIHSLAINHLDVKPANIMRRKSDGAYILIDFGLTKQYDATTGNQTSTTPVGISHGYAPIEQYRAGGVSEFSPQTDVYSLGATLYYLLTGVVPPEPAVLIDSPLAFIGDIPTHLQAAIVQAMKQSKSKRPATVADFCRLLDEPTSNTPSTSQTTNTQSQQHNDEPTVLIHPQPAMQQPVQNKYEIDHSQDEEEESSPNLSVAFAILAAFLVGIFIYVINSSNRDGEAGAADTESIYWYEEAGYAHGDSEMMPAVAADSVVW